MKLSKKTLAILTNFASINPNIVIHAGSTIRTMAEAKNIMAEAQVDEVFPDTFGIYDLPEFLSVLNLFTDPDLAFSEDMLSIKLSEGSKRATYYLSPIANLTFPQKDIIMPAAEVSFTFTNDMFSRLRDASRAFKTYDLVVTSDPDSTELNCLVTDIADDTANQWHEVIEDTESNDTCKLVFNINNFKMIPGDYSAQISSKLISKFSGDSVDYFVALEKSSSFGG
jgi:hypothetical protein